MLRIKLQELLFPVAKLSCLVVSLTKMFFFVDKVNALSVWWSGGTQLFIYSLVKAAKGANLIDIDI